MRNGESEMLKLDIGDYTALGEYYDYTFVDRKSGNDLQGTVGKHNIERFEREIERAQEMGAYLVCGDRIERRKND